MSYNQYPSKDEITVSVTDNKITLDQLNTCHDCPDKIEEFLRSCGWENQMFDPNNQEPLFVKTDQPDTQHMSYRWYEAMSYEFWRFITLNSGSDS